MKIMKLLLISGFALAGFCNAWAEVVIEQEPLRYENIRGLTGAEMYTALCASCHGVTGEGNGPAAGYIQKAVPDLTNYSDCNNGSFPHRKVEAAIYGRDRDPHAELSMPTWGTQFMLVSRRWSPFVSESYARERIHELALHIESLQD